MKPIQFVNSVLLATITCLRKCLISSSNKHLSGLSCQNTKASQYIYVLSKTSLWQKLLVPISQKGRSEVIEPKPHWKTIANKNRAKLCKSHQSNDSWSSSFPWFVSYWGQEVPAVFAYTVTSIRKYVILFCSGIAIIKISFFFLK